MIAIILPENEMLDFGRIMGWKMGFSGFTVTEKPFILT